MTGPRATGAGTIRGGADVKVAVVGAGVVGLAASAALLDRGADVVCLDRAGPMAERSTGSSRIFRLAHGSADLVALARDARAGWARWSEAAGRPLVRDVGCLVSGALTLEWTAVMLKAGAPYTMVGPDWPELGLPVRRAPHVLLHDTTGGVIDAEATGAHLTARVGPALRTSLVYALEERGTGARVHTPDGPLDVDAVLIAAGAGTSPLAAEVGLYTPAGLAHHVRFTFATRQAGPLRAWIDQSPGRLATYQHLAGPGRWSVGGLLDHAGVDWEAGRAEATRMSREAVLGYVREHLDGVAPAVLDELYCTTVAGLGDGFHLRRRGPFTAVYGDNLFKFAPLLGDLLAAAVTEGTEDVVDYV
ncbi:FAD-dependent oxidoreductase [Phytohabitans sp. ZYX-F-186]|uniref:FAD-dependent oxidoreductase n=1 Tax=Phytohabitans maris TaxID=3071409 RepID=A0ABU0ZPH9_9ACTN|nr:FAD-dependent oxidoreductase [Phytohabitans sp. ZYX-F-186]MDQ7908631.1 FAD-dependent oxidoreductase [Phytohabitans sp. ZYX-F-186]